MRCFLINFHLQQGALVGRHVANNTTNNLKNELQKVNTAISNIMSAIEKGILTETTKSRLEELEKQRNDLQEQIVIAQSKGQFMVLKEDIQNYFKNIMKECPEQAIEKFIKHVKVYADKIEIALNGILATPNLENSKKIGTETQKLIRHFKGNTTKETTRKYDIYLTI